MVLRFRGAIRNLLKGICTQEDGERSQQKNTLVGHVLIW